MHAYSRITQAISQSETSELKLKPMKLTVIAAASLLCGLNVSATLMDSVANAQTDAAHQSGSTSAATLGAHAQSITNH